MKCFQRQFDAPRLCHSDEFGPPFGGDGFAQFPRRGGLIGDAHFFGQCRQSGPFGDQLGEGRNIAHASDYTNCIEHVNAQCIARVGKMLGMSAPNERLKLARETAGYKQAADAARRYHWNEPTYYAHENGSRGFKSKAVAYAAKFTVNLEWLLTGKGEMRTGSTVPLMGYVGAGGLIMPTGDRDIVDHVPAPPEMGRDTEAVQVRGDSQYPAYGDGDLIYYEQIPGVLEDAVGHMCVVMTAAGERMLKMVKRGTKKGHYNLISVNAPPLDDVILEWAAPITWVKKWKGLK